MTHTSTEQPEALRLTKALEAYWCVEIVDIKAASRELRRLHARVQELEASQAQRVPLSDEQIEKLRHSTFSTSNPFCPCDSKTMRKVVRAAELAHGITQEKQG